MYPSWEAGGGSVGSVIYTVIVMGWE